MISFLYAALGSLFVPLALAAQNLDQGIQPADISLPLILAICIGGLAHLLSLPLSNDRDRRALIATAMVALAYLPALLAPLLPDEWTLQVRSLVLLIVAGAGGSIVGMVFARMRWVPTGVSRFLLILFAILCSIQVVRIAVFSVQPVESPLTEAPSVTQVSLEGPDIWLIILDAYTGTDVLRESYDLDVHDFLSELQDRDFHVPAASRANYVNTVLSLASMLNQRYLDGLGDGFNDESETLRAGSILLEDNQTARDLKARGYEFVFFRSAFPFLARNQLADQQIPDHVIGEFTRYWLRQTLVYSAVGFYCWLAKCQDRPWFVQAGGVVEVDQKIARLTQLAAARERVPRFVFVHFLLPHGPMRLTSECESREPVWPQTPQEAAVEELRILYADQVRCTNDKILALVDGLLEASDRPPVILLQGDHGYGRFPRGRTLPLASSTPEQVHDRTSVFGAYFLPDDRPPEVVFWDSITPVNVLRVVMHAIFHEPLDALPDRTFWSDWDHPYAFEELETTARAEPSPPSAGKSSGP